MTAAGAVPDALRLRGASEFLWDDTRHCYANVGSSANARVSLAHVFIKDLIVHYIPKLYFPPGRPIGQALLGAPDDVSGTNGWI